MLNVYGNCVFALAVDERQTRVSTYMEDLTVCCVAVSRVVRCGARVNHNTVTQEPKAPYPSMSVEKRKKKGKNDYDSTCLMTVIRHT